MQQLKQGVVWFLSGVAFALIFCFVIVVKLNAERATTVTNNTIGKIKTRLSKTKDSDVDINAEIERTTTVSPESDKTSLKDRIKNRVNNFREKRKQKKSKDSE